MVKKLEFIILIVAIGVFVFVSTRYYDPVLAAYEKPLTTLAKDKLQDYLNSKNLGKDFNSYVLSYNERDYVDKSSSAKTVPVLIYHAIPNTATRDTEVSKQSFKEQMFALKKAGYQTVTLEDLYAFLKGEKELPAKSFVLTFDDGIKSSFYNVDPILKSIGYNAVMFIIAGYSLNNEYNPYYLTKDELLKAEETGRWEIQAHAYLGHRGIPVDAQGDLQPYYANKIWRVDKGRLETNQEFEARVYHDLKSAKEKMEKELGKEIYAFAIPFNNFGQVGSNYPEAQNVLMKLYKEVYNLVFFQFRPVQGTDYTGNYAGKKIDNFYTVMRMEFFKDTTASDLLNSLEASQAKSLPYKESFQNLTNWISLWGDRVFNDENVFLAKSNSNSTSSMTYLDGSYLWKDYEFTLKGNWDKGEYVSLIARYQDSNNYLGCSFRNGSVSIEKRVQNSDQKIATRLYNIHSGAKNITLGVKVSGSGIVCSVNGQAVLSNAAVAGSISNGGIGIKTWDPQPANSQLTINDINVKTVK